MIYFFLLLNCYLYIFYSSSCILYSMFYVCSCFIVYFIGCFFVCAHVVFCICRFICSYVVWYVGYLRSCLILFVRAFLFCILANLLVLIYNSMLACWFLLLVSFHFSLFVYLCFFPCSISLFIWASSLILFYSCLILFCFDICVRIVQFWLEWFIWFLVFFRVVGFPLFFFSSTIFVFALFFYLCSWLILFWLIVLMSSSVMIYYACVLSYLALF